ncbi:M20/M25/M40 family metallo-hydrolase [Lactiplantibacillus daowaiensis]|uniref:M20/M25/M40 family metallo-hydrolase n=1 Tax=Lactiplantibacillus daowaiensis TaxID=2559918 RepID=A0ABW1S2E9_9LACO|nr:M20/M25/M40 family metallo-hydrolase [Lactiplantibacillus daowaiensis]
MTTRDQIIQAQLTAYLAKLAKLVGFNTVSQAGQHDLPAGGTYLVDLLQHDLKADVTVVPTDGAPAIVAQLTGTSDQTVLFYGHYDTMAPGDLAQWHTDPFQLTPQAGRLFGRGVGDNKGQLMAQILGVYTYLQTHATLPLNIVFLIEGEEEQGSPNLAPTVTKLKTSLLAAVDLAVVIDGSMSQSGQHVLRLGNRGLFGFELTAITGQVDNHSGNTGNVMPNAIVKLNTVLARLVKNGRVQLPHFYDGVPTTTEIPWDLVDALPFDALAIARQLGLTHVPAQRDYYRRLMFEPTFNLNSYQAGTTGPDFKTIIPHQATVKVDCRLVGQQSIPAIEADLRQALASELAAGTLKLTIRGRIPASVTALSMPKVQQIAGIIKSATGAVVIEPMMPGTVPNYVWTDILKVPVVTIPYANFDQHNHAPNENLTETAFVAGIKIGYELVDQLATVIGNSN